jgi:hypothetical protein
MVVMGWLCLLARLLKFLLQLVEVVDGINGSDVVTGGRL